MVGYRLHHTLSEFGSVSRGICQVNEAGFLTKITERTKIEQHANGLIFMQDNGHRIDFHGREITSMNMWGFTPLFLEQLDAGLHKFLAEWGGDPRKEFYLTDVIGELIETGGASIEVFPTESRWFGMTYQADKALVMGQLEARVDAGMYPSPLLKK